MLFDTMLLQRSDFYLSTAHPVHNQSAIEPDICLTDGGGWIIWTQQSLTGDRICARSFSETGFGPVIDWSSVTGIEYQPAIIAPIESSDMVEIICAAGQDQGAVGHILGGLRPVDAQEAAMLVAGGVERGQQPGSPVPSLLANPWVIAGVVAAAVAIPVAMAGGGRKDLPPGS